MPSDTLTSHLERHGLSSDSQQKIAELLVAEFGDDAPFYARRIVHALREGTDAPAIALWCIILARIGHVAEAKHEFERFSDVLSQVATPLPLEMMMSRHVPRAAAF